MASHAVGLRRNSLAACLAAALSLGASAVPVTGTDAMTVLASVPDWVSEARLRDDEATPSQPSRAPRRSTQPAATTLTPSNCADSGAGSLRAAMTAAVDGDTIDLTHLACSLITLTTGALVTHANNLHMIGPGAGALDISGNQDSSVVYHLGTGTLGVFGVTFADGSYTASTNPTGGCIYSSGNVALYSSTVRGCALAVASTTKARGGGIYTKGDLTLVASNVTDNIVSNSVQNALGGGVFAKGSILVAYSTISDNVAHAPAVTGAHGYGGGLVNVGDAAIVGSTISGNQAGVAAGIAFVGTGATQTQTLKESTISGNHASQYIGGLRTGQATVHLFNCTIAFNTETTVMGAGIYDYNALQLDSTIIANNMAPSGSNDLGGNGISTVTGHNNLIMHSTIAVIPNDTLSVDPLLAPLADYGGLTLTHALPGNSPAVDHGANPGSFTVDQRGRGFVRLAGGAVDIGAFERNSDLIFVNGFN
jgi:hypothetical protein